MLKHLIAVAFVIAATMQSFGHCEVPCGIYDDQARVKMMYEQINTIVTSMTQINKLSQEGKPNYNQLVRWITTKDDHANQLQDIITQYFMTQRLIPTSKEDKNYDKYIRELTLMHELLVKAMKCKQTTDLSIPEGMQKTLHDFQHSYFTGK